MATSALSRPGNVYRDGRCRCRPSSALHLATSQATSFLSTLLPRLPRAGGVDHRALLVRRGVVVRAVTTDGLRRRHAQLLQAREHGGRHGGVGLVTVRQEVNGLLGVVADVVQAARVRRADLAVIVRTERRVSRARVLGCHHRDGRNYRLGGGGGGTVQCDGAVVAGEAVVELVRPRREGGAACRVVGILQVNVPARGVPVIVVRLVQQLGARHVHATTKHRTPERHAVQIVRATVRRNVEVKRSEYGRVPVAHVDHVVVGAPPEARRDDVRVRAEHKGVGAYAALPERELATAQRVVVAGAA
mmetsp:Transcript_87347/g.247911  ORF Transcript_87347/g.247911 Transcript_87347/m.247911 type:complete len:303 (+) Transcript_87347:118-1026(+)